MEVAANIRKQCRLQGDKKIMIKHKYATDKVNNYADIKENICNKEVTGVDVYESID